jgi:hypothetical protein
MTAQMKRALAVIAEAKGLVSPKHLARELGAPVNGVTIRDEIEECRDADLWEEAVSIEASDREVLVEASRRWDDVASFLMHLDDPEEDQS